MSLPSMHIQKLRDLLLQPRIGRIRRLIITVVSVMAVISMRRFVGTLNTSSYDPKKCEKMVDGHCEDENGGAWSYKNDDGACSHKEESAPRDWGAAATFPTLFPSVASVMDFGGGLGPYLIAFRNKGVKELVVMEPRSFGKCLFRGLKQDTSDVINTDLKRLPKQKFDLVMTIEVVEHIPVEFHPHIIDFLTQATKKYILFSAAHPKQKGQGHVGPSMKTRDQWVNDFISRQPDFEVDTEITKELHAAAGYVLKANGVVFRKKVT